MIAADSNISDPPLRVMSLHALLYCERLFYLEEVEEIRVADANVYAGRRLHVERLPLDDETPELRSFEVSSDTWGLFGKVDAVQWLTYGGRFMAGTTDSPGRVQQRIRQFQGLSDAALCLDLARRTVQAKVEGQLRYLLRSTRGDADSRRSCRPHLDRIRETLRKRSAAVSLDSLRGLEGMAAKAYFAAVPRLLSERVPAELHPSGRSKRPPKDRFNCLLSFGYGMTFALVQRTVMAVGLEPAFGYFHQPRSAAPPLVLDLMELFRVLLVDMPVIASVNRVQWNAADDFTSAGAHVWLSDGGRKKAIALFESRLGDSYKHPVNNRSMDYIQLVELEVRLLEKEWSGSPGLFGRLRIR